MTSSMIPARIGPALLIASIYYLIAMGLELLAEYWVQSEEESFAAGTITVRVKHAGPCQDDPFLNKESRLTSYLSQTLDL